MKKLLILLVAILVFAVSCKSLAEAENTADGPFFSVVVTEKTSGFAVDGSCTVIISLSPNESRVLSESLASEISGKGIDATIAGSGDGSIVVQKAPDTRVLVVSGGTMYLEMEGASTTKVNAQIRITDYATGNLAAVMSVSTEGFGTIAEAFGSLARTVAEELVSL